MTACWLIVLLMLGTAPMVLTAMVGYRLYLEHRPTLWQPLLLQRSLAT